jgi:soluble P-type ATPase
MALKIEIPGRQPLELDYLLLDQNGTLSLKGEVLSGVRERLDALTKTLSIHILSGDSFGTLDRISSDLSVDARRVKTGVEKREFVDQLGGYRCAAIGNGYNDVEMFNGCGLSIAIIGPEGASSHAVIAAQVVCGSILNALDLLLDTRLLVATLKA